MFKVGDIVYIKTTGEPGTILWLEDIGAFGLLGAKVEVRTTGSAPNVPATYPRIMFYEAELETMAERVARDYQDAALLRKQLEQLQGNQEIAAVPSRVN